MTVRSHKAVTKEYLRTWRSLNRQLVRLQQVQAQLAAMSPILAAIPKSLSMELMAELDAEDDTPKVKRPKRPATAPPVPAPQQLHTPPRKLTAKEQEAAADAALRAECKAVVFAACADTSNPIYTNKLAEIIRDHFDDAMIHSYMVQYDIHAEEQGLPTTGDQDAWYWANFRAERGTATEADQPYIGLLTPVSMRAAAQQQELVGATA